MGSVPVFPKDPYGGAYGAAPQLTTQVDELIGSAYDVVRHVAENIEYVKHVSHHLAEIYELSQHTEAIDALYENIENLEILLANLNDMLIVAANIDAVNDVAGSIDAVNTVSDNINELLIIQENMLAFLSVLRDFATRADLVAHIAAYPAGTVVGRVYNAGDYQYIGSPGSTDIPDLPGLTPYGILHPQHFGAIGDGTTNDDTGAQRVVAMAFATGQEIYWEAGTYLTTTNIPDFHGVRHSGPGLIKRGTDIFTIEPKDIDTNHIYVSVSGSDSNDGFTANLPIRTLGKVKAILVDTQANQRGGTWEMKFEAGTYNDSTNFPDLPIFRNPIRFIGTGTSRTPQTIFDGAVATYKTAGMYFQNRTNVYLQYLKFINFTIGYGALAEHNCQIELDDCEAVNCNLGFSAGYSSFIRTTRCLASNCANGFQVSSNSQAAFAPRTGLIADSNRAYGCGYGFSVTRMSYAHVDYNEIEDCTFAGLKVEMNSRTATLGNNFKRNALAVRCWTSGYISIDTGDPNIYNQADAVNRNLEVYEFRGSSGIVNDHGQLGTMNVSLYRSTTPVTVTGTVSITQVGGTLYTASAGWFTDNSKRIKFKAWGTVTTPVDGTISLQLRMANTGLTVLSIPSGVTAKTWLFDAEVVPTAFNVQKTLASIRIDGVFAITDIHATAIDCLVADRDFNFSTDANGAGGAASTITVESMELIVSG